MSFDYFQRLRRPHSTCCSIIAYARRRGTTLWRASGVFWAHMTPLSAFDTKGGPMPEALTDQPPASATCAFCRIIHGEEQASVVFEDDLSLAFLDHRPLFPGHCLLVPKAHYERLSDLLGSRASSGPGNATGMRQPCARCRILFARPSPGSNHPPSEG